MNKNTVTDNISLISLPALSDNYIWMLKNNSHAVVVDPGVAAPVLANLKGLQLEAILITHHHNDHTGGIQELKQLTGAKVYGPRDENIPACDIKLAQDDIIDLPGLGIQMMIMDIPGHTLGHIAYTGTINEQAIIFCGDTLFAAGCGRVFEGTPAQMHTSLCKIKTLAPETLVCCAHEYTAANIKWALAVDPDNTSLQQRAKLTAQLRANKKPTVPSELALELETNPFLRTDNITIVNSASAYAGQQLNTPEEVFASLRQWKNEF